MKHRTWIPCLVAMVLAGCQRGHGGPVEPHAPPPVARVSGVITYPDSSGVRMARVWIRDVDTAFTDTTGAYALQVPVSTDTLRVYARDGYEPGVAYVQTRWNGAVVVPDRDRKVDIVLIYIDPI